ncbi:MAG: iron-sulfur cluster assembly accessory protein [Candidatus Nanoarchaeia archaeon]|nr:iron-sulfur cluster assembly accessory protein [Candidatus Nanoarchaeia archaeon]
METKNQSQITLTDNAVKRITTLIQQQNRQDEGVRVKVVPGGCSGFKYDLNFGKPSANDIIVEYQGVKIITDGESMPFLIGSKIEFIEDLHGARFEVINPNEASQCGCGSSVGF